MRRVFLPSRSRANNTTPGSRPSSTVFSSRSSNVAIFHRMAFVSRTLYLYLSLPCVDDKRIRFQHQSEGGSRGPFRHAAAAENNPPEQEGKPKKTRPPHKTPTLAISV